MSKTSRPRPFSVPLEEFGNNHETIFGKKPPKERYVPPPLPDMEEKPKQTITFETKEENK
jgi:hypothetical protein